MQLADRNLQRAPTRILLAGILRKIGNPSKRQPLPNLTCHHAASRRATGVFTPTRITSSMQDTRCGRLSRLTGLVVAHDLLVLYGTPQQFDEDIAPQQYLPVMLMLIALVSSRSVNDMLVNYLPCSVLKISSVPKSIKILLLSVQVAAPPTA